MPKNKCFQDVDEYEEKKAKKIRRKYMKEIAKIINKTELIIGTIKYDCNQLISDLDFREKLIVKEVKEITKKFKVQERILDAIYQKTTFHKGII